MPKNVLNIAAGLLPIVASDLNVDKVVNYDPLSGLSKSGDQGKLIVSHFIALTKALGDIKYARRQSEVDAEYPNGSVDLVLSISPFGFTLIDTWVHNKLSVGSHVLVLGNKSNKFVSKADKLFDAAIYNQYSEHGESGHLSEPWIDNIIDRIHCAKIESLKTDPIHGSTTLDLIRIFKRIPELVPVVA